METSKGPIKIRPFAVSYRDGTDVEWRRIRGRIRDGQKMEAQGI
jgi:hypothetical protein